MLGLWNDFIRSPRDSETYHLFSCLIVFIHEYLICHNCFQPVGESMNKRCQSRKEVSNLVVEASDGNVLYSGIVSNVSYSGLVLDDVPPEIYHRGEILSLTMFSKR